MHTWYKAKDCSRCICAGMVVAGFFCTLAFAQVWQPAGALIMDPYVTGQQVLSFSEFERAASEAADKAEIAQGILAAILQDFKKSNPIRVVRPQEWRFSLLHLFYQNNVALNLVDKFFLNLPFYPVDTGFLEEMQAGNNGEKREGVNIQIPHDAGAQPNRVGNLGVKAPVPIYQALPSYTEEARKARVQGAVLLQVIIRKDGSIDSFKVVKGLGYGLDESAITTVKTKWRFQPGTLNEIPVDVQANVEVSFRLY
jgi:TonB family protein